MIPCGGFTTLMRQLPLLFAITRGRLFFKMIPIKQPQRLFTRMKKAVLREDMMALTQDVTQALVLGQMLYWTKTLDKVNDWLFEENKRLAEVELPQHEYNYGWIYKSAREMREDLMNAFSEDAIQRAFSSLVTKGILMKRKNPIVRYDRKLQYRVDIVFLRRLLKDRGYEMTDFQLATIPQEAEFIPQGAVCMTQGAETITEINTKIKNIEKPLTPFQGEEENSAMASHSSVQPNVFQTSLHESQASGSATAELKSADGKKKTPRSEAPPRPTKSKSTQIEKPISVSEQVWDDFLALRKAKRAPLSQTALTAIAKEAEKASVTLEEALIVCLTRGWQGFNAEWMKKTTGFTKPEKLCPI
jgi:hypothetical protein